jgi:hypothetical protein
MQLMPFNYRRPAQIFAFLAVNALLACAYLHYLGGRFSYYDDTFIYLHNAANVVEHFDANYYLPANSHALLSSSPLRLAALSIAMAIAEILHAPRSLDAARVALALAAFLQMAVFGLYWILARDRAAQWRGWGLAALYWGMGLVMHSFFEMEGCVVFVTIAALFEAITRRSYGLIGCFAVLTVLARPDLGVLSCIFAATMLRQVAWRTWLIPAARWGAVAAVCYVIVFACLKVYFIPTTVWAKFLSGQSHQFTQENFLTSLPGQIGQILTSAPPVTFTAKLAGTAFLSIGVASSFALMGRYAVVPVIASALVLSRLPAGFLWYYENVLACIVLLIMAASIAIARRSRIAKAGAYVMVVAFACWVGMFSLPPDDLPWNVRKGPDEHSRGRAYVALAALHQGKGIFNLPNYGQAYIRVCEIGMISYFSGSTVWTNDLCGLAQTANFPQATSSPLRFLFPRSLRRTGDEELRQFGDRNLPVIDVWARDDNDDTSAKQRCAAYTSLFCMNPFRLGPMPAEAAPPTR